MRGLWRDAARRFVRHRVGMIGATILAGLVLLAIFGPSLAPYPPNSMDFSAPFSPPSFSHPARHG